MSTRFDTILIPVDFTINTKLALEKALAFSSESTELHLLHVTGTSGVYNRIFSLSYFDSKPMPADAARQELDKLREEIIRGNEGIDVFTNVSDDGDVEKAIWHEAFRVGADLIIIGKSSEHWLPVFNTVLCGRLARNTGLPVLTVKPGALNHDIRTVVIPVERKFSFSKVPGMLSMIKKTRMQICLLAFADEKKGADHLPPTLLNSYRLFKRNAFNNVSFNIIRDHNKGRAVLNFCRSVNADLLIVNPESETGLGWFNGHLSDTLPAASKTQILAV